MNKRYLIKHLKKEGFKLNKLGRNIAATRDGETIRGSVNAVHATVFGYYVSNRVQRVSAK